MKKARRLTLREKKLTPYSWELDLNDCVASEVIGQGGFGVVYRYENSDPLENVKFITLIITEVYTKVKKSP